MPCLGGESNSSLYPPYIVSNPIQCGRREARPYWTPNFSNLLGKVSDKYLWRRTSYPRQLPVPMNSDNLCNIPPGLFSCYLEATAGRGAQFDAASFSSSTMSSGISSLGRSRSASSASEMCHRDSDRSRKGKSLPREFLGSIWNDSSEFSSTRHRSRSPSVGDKSNSRGRSLKRKIPRALASMIRKAKTTKSPDDKHRRCKSCSREVYESLVRNKSPVNQRYSSPISKNVPLNSALDISRYGTARARSLGCLDRNLVTKFVGAPQPPYRRKKGLPYFSIGDLVWFDPGLGYLLPGEVVEFHRAGQVITVQAVIGGKTQVFTLTNLSSIRRRQDLGEDGVEDMISLSDLNEASLLWNLKIRYDKEKIYTYTGSILVALNPYRMFDIYGLDVVKKYEGQILGTLPPHIFAIGSSAYSRMSKDLSSQCVVISGESGAGKTESTKLIMQYLAAVNKSQSNLITEQILEASPLLESFGNAKSIKNDNSSRFGKYLEVYFKGGVVTGAKITEYLLEKSRIVTQAPEERNYHVFYELLAGLSKEKKNKYGLASAEKYFYLNQGGNCVVPNKDDADDFQALMSAMQVLGFSSEEQDTIFRVLASVLHLGNIYFNRKQLRHGQEGVEIGSDVEIKWVAHLLNLDADGIKRALTTKTTEARHERVTTPLTIDQALDARDAVAKALYASLFTWLVARINMIIHKGETKTSISILDIFGFEIFKENSFEQLCINYANEKLHYYFNKHVFKLEQQEYAKEKIEWQTIDFQDNLPVIELIARKPVGILHLLDDESNFPKATDASYLEKCHYNHALNELYARPRMSTMEFGIKHYAGQVWYNVDGFLDKNRDTLRNDVVDLLISSKLSMLSIIFMEMRVGSENKTLTRANGRFVTMKPRTPTVAARFNDSLSSLIESMSRSNPWFIRCIKPNNDKASLKLDMPIVLEQLRYSGMLDTIKIRQQGYPIRIRFSHFAERYRCIVPGQVPRGAPSKEICRVVLDRSGLKNSRGNYTVGVTKIFLKESLEKDLEQHRYKKLSHAVVTIQRHTRGLIARKKYKQYRKSALVIQAAVRMWIARKRYRTLKTGIVKAQAMVRGQTTRKKYIILKDEASKRKRAEALAKQRAASQKKETSVTSSQRSVAAVTHLEIPAELAFILSRASGWSGPYKTHGYVSRWNGYAVPDKTSYRLPHDVDYHAFTKFTNVYFKSHLWGMKRDPIKTPFLPKNRDADYAESLSIFKLLLRFMNDPSLAGSKEIILGNYIANKGLQNERLRDEILCQLSNQTWKNDNVENSQRGWLLMANCLSSFAPSSSLYKYLLKYVSDHGMDSYSNLCQRKLLSARTYSSGITRNFPPTELEWKSNQKRSKMVLSAGFYDGRTGASEIDSWTTCEDFASYLLQDRGISSTNGWTTVLEEEDKIIASSHLDYVFDLIGYMEAPPSFPANSSTIFELDDSMYPSDEKSIPISSKHTSESPLVARRTRSPPPLTKKLSREALAAHDVASRDTEAAEFSRGLSRTSALNNRYFDDKSKSRSLDNLLEPSSNIENLGLSGSKLNDRYHSVERLSGIPNATPRVDSNGIDFDHMESVSQRGLPEHELLAAEMRDSVGTGLAGSKAWNKYQLGENRLAMDSEDLNENYSRSMSNRYVKGGHAGRKSYSGSQSSRGYIERGEMKSSAMSDTSETPSLASHVRRVRVPSQASDVDQFVDDLFMPVLDTQLDELSDARSLAASIKGGKKQEEMPHSRDSGEILNNEQGFARGPGSFRRQNLVALLEDVKPSEYLKVLSQSKDVALMIKGGGNGPADVQPNVPASSSGITHGGYYPGGAPIPSNMQATSPGFQPLNTIPLYSPGATGLTYPGMAGGGQIQTNQVDPHQMMSYQQNLQRAFLQSAVSQNIQIQQHLIAQNQALQQLMQPQAIPHVGMPMQDPNTSSVMGLNALGLSTLSGVTPQQVAQMPLGIPGIAPVNQYQPAKITGWSNNTNSSSKVSFQEPEQGELWSSEKARNMSSNQRDASHGLRGPVVSPPPPLLAMGNQISPVGLAFQHAAAASSPIPDQNNRKGSADEMRMSFDTSASPRYISSPIGGQIRSPQGQEMSPGGENYIGHVPVPPPMPSHLAHDDPNSPYMDPYERAKTVRIGKWRWPPPKEDMNSSSFMQFKKKQQNHKKKDPKDLNRSDSKDGSVEIEWEEFEFNEGEMPPHAYHNVSTNGEIHTSHKLHAKYVKQTTTKKEIEEFETWDELEAREAHEISNRSMNGTRDSSREMRNEKEKREPKERVRKDSWDSGEDDEKGAGIGKLKISREMKEKLEALTSTHSSKPKRSGSKKSKDKVVRKLEENRRFLLQQQLAGDRWDSVHAITDITDHAVSSRLMAPPAPIGPDHISSRRRHHSPTESISSEDSAGVIPNTRSPPPPIKPSHDRRSRSFRKERRSSISSLHGEATEQFELEESSEFLKPVDKVPRIKDEEKEKKTIESMKTKLLPPCSSSTLTYSKVPWKLSIRKELFAPNETLSDDALHLVFCQVVRDAYGSPNLRLPVDDRNSLRKEKVKLFREKVRRYLDFCSAERLYLFHSQFISDIEVTPENMSSSQHSIQVKKDVIENAKKCPLYFSSIFPILNSRKPNESEYIAISHASVFFLRIDSDHFEVINNYNLHDIEQAVSPRGGSLRLIFTNGSSAACTTPRARQIAAIISRFIVFSHLEI